MGEPATRSAGSEATPRTVRHGRLRRPNPWLTLTKWIAGTASVVLASSVSITAIAAAQFTGNIETVDISQPDDEPLPSIGEFEGGFNVLIVGSDTRDGQAATASDTGVSGERNDVNILVHVSQDHTQAVAVSIPRDLVVPIPACPREDGSGFYPAMSAQPINSSMMYGGLACTVMTVEALTGLEIPYAGVVTFDGVATLATAVGGVEVCVDGPINDAYSGLSLPAAGTYSLEGMQALQFLRTRHGVGDGSDLGRISSQQVYMSSLVRKLKSSDTLTNPVTLYNLAKVITENMRLSTSLANLDTLVSMANVLTKLDLEKVTFVQYPGTTGLPGVYAGKVAPLEAQATELFDKIRNDEHFVLAEGNTGQGSALNPNAPAETPPPAETGAPADPGATPGPADPAATPPPGEAGPEELDGVLGQTAADFTCSVANN